MSVTIHQAVSGDIPNLVELMHEFHAESGFTLARAGATKAFAALLREESRGLVWIASEDDVPAGYVVLTFRFSMEFGGTDAFIDDLFVRPSRRRTGLGDALLKELYAECERRRVHAVRVEVASDNEPAKALYQKYGMQESRRLTLTVELTPNPIATKGDENGSNPNGAKLG